jgi:hypothetical protein
MSLDKCCQVFGQSVCLLDLVPWPCTNTCMSRQGRATWLVNKVCWNNRMPSGQAEVAGLNQKAEDATGQMDEKLAVVVADAMHHLFKARGLTMDVKVAPLQLNASMTHSQLRVAWFDLFLLSQWKRQVSSEFVKGNKSDSRMQKISRITCWWHGLVVWQVNDESRPTMSNTPSTRQSI